jgi:FlaA1/EpsC-like NDP-sugar epimerase
MDLAMSVQEDKMSQKLEEFSCSPVAAFYEGKTVFITGATGFMGKVLSPSISF